MKTGKPWTAKIKLLKSLPMAAMLDNSGGAGQTSLPDGLTLDQFDGMFVALEYRAGEPGSDEMTVHGYYRQYDGTVNQLRQCQ